MYPIRVEGKRLESRVFLMGDRRNFQRSALR